MTTNKLRIAYLNRADAATLTASPGAASTSPVRYLQNDSRLDMFSAVAVGSQAILGDWGGTAYTIGCMRLDRTNLVDGDTLRLQLYSDLGQLTEIGSRAAAAPFATDLYDTWDYSNAELFFAPVAGVKSFKITVVSAAVFQASRLFLGPYTEAAINPEEGAAAGWIDLSEQKRLKSGTLAVNVGAMHRSLPFSMMVNTEATRAAWMEIGRYSGTSKTVWVSVFPGDGTALERDHSFMGKFKESPMMKIMTNKYDFSLTLNEI